MRRHTALLWCLLAGAWATQGAAPIRALIFSGRNNHDWRTTTPWLKKILEDSGRFEVRVTEEPAGTTAATLARYDVLVLDYNGPRWGVATGAVTLPATLQAKPAAAPVRVQLVTGGHDHELSFYAVLEGDDRIAVTVNPHPDAYNRDLRQRFDVLVLYDMVQEIPEVQKKNLQEFLESGKGLVALHHSIASFNGWPWYEEVIGGKYLLKPEERRAASTYKHDEALSIRPVAKHPVLAGIGPMQVRDEAYKGKRISPDVQVLLATDNPNDDGPVAWISPYRKSRVIYIELGHDHFSHQHPGYRTLVRQAILWAAGRLGQP